MLSRTIFRNLKGCSFFTRSIHPLFFSSAADDEISEAEKAKAAKQDTDYYIRLYDTLRKTDKTKVKLTKEEDQWKKEVMKVYDEKMEEMWREHKNDMNLMVYMGRDAINALPYSLQKHAKKLDERVFPPWPPVKRYPPNFEEGESIWEMKHGNEEGEKFQRELHKKNNLKRKRQKQKKKKNMSEEELIVDGLE